MAKLYEKELPKKFDCRNCNEEAKKVRHCPFIDKSDWVEGTIYLPEENFDVCPLGYIIQHQHLLIFFELKKAFDCGIPPYANLGYLEMPNLICECLNVLHSEMGFYGKEERKFLETL